MFPAKTVECNEQTTKRTKGAKEKGVASSLAREGMASWCNREEASLMRNTLFTEKITLIISNILNTAIKFK